MDNHKEPRVTEQADAVEQALCEAYPRAAQSLGEIQDRVIEMRGFRKGYAAALTRQAAPEAPTNTLIGKNDAYPFGIPPSTTESTNEAWREVPVHQWRRTGESAWHDSCQEVAYMSNGEGFEARTLYPKAYMQTAIDGAVERAAQATHASAVDVDAVLAEFDRLSNILKTPGYCDGTKYTRKEALAMAIAASQPQKGSEA